MLRVDKDCHYHSLVHVVFVLDLALWEKYCWCPAKDYTYWLMRAPNVVYNMSYFVFIQIMYTTSLISNLINGHEILNILFFMIVPQN